MNPKLETQAREALAHALGNFYLNDKGVIEAVSTYLVTGDCDHLFLNRTRGYPEPRRTGNVDALAILVLGYLVGAWAGEVYHVSVDVYVGCFRSAMRMPPDDTIPKYEPST